MCQVDPAKTAYLVPNAQKKYDPISYAEHWANVQRYAKVLLDLGLRKGDMFNLFSENCYEWALVDWAAQTLGIITVPIYPTLPGDQATYIIQDCGSKLVVCGNEDLAKRVEGCGVPIALLRNSKDAIAEKASAAKPLPVEEMQIKTTTRSEVATLIYTSGTTGNPKGVMLTHDSFLFMMDAIQSNVPLLPTDTFFSFLPLSHVYERVNGHVLPIALSATIGYCTSYASLAKELLEIRPTVMLCVPRFLDAMRTRVLDAMEKAPPIRQKLFHATLAQGKAKLNNKPAPFLPILDKIVGKKIRDRMGGRLRFFVSGGAALPAHVAEFFGAFNLPVLQGYGMTETCSGVFVNVPDDNDYRTIGTAIGGVEAMIAADGEILIRGRCNMKGYWNLPEDTAQTIDVDGWLHTGDIGEFQGKKLKITDRKKDLLILGNGKNVAPQPIENLLRESKYLAEAVLFGDSMEYVCALIVPEFDQLRHFAQSNGIKTTDPKELLELEPIKKLLKTEVDAVNKKLADYEKVKRYVFLTQGFSVESGELTPSMKVKRRVVQERYTAEIASMSRS